MSVRTVTVVAFGDSITEAQTGVPDPEERWLAILERGLVRHFPEIGFRVVNAGKGGNSAREAMARFEHDVLRHRPDWVLLEFGGNNHDYRSPERLVSLVEFKQHLERFRRELPAATRVAVITFPPILDELHCYTPLHMIELEVQGGLDRAMESHREMTRWFARTNGFPLIDLDRMIRERWGTEGRLHYTLPDGVHLSPAGNQLLAGAVLDALLSHGLRP